MAPPPADALPHVEGQATRRGKLSEQPFDTVPGERSTTFSQSTKDVRAVL